jgi:hypothetical protein
MHIVGLTKMSVQGVNISATLEPLLRQPTLLIFLRHFGCIFCRELVADMRRAAADPDYPPMLPPMLFVYQGTPAAGEAFFADLWPEAKAVAAPNQQLYHAFGLARGNVSQMFGAKVWACGVRAALKGHFIGKPVGDPWLMPGVFVVHGEQVLWRHDFVHAGDHPNIPKLLNVVRDLRLAGANG